MTRNPRASLLRLAGFTLVEIMIGLLIGVIGIVVIMQVFAVSEGFKRTATSGTDAQVNGSLALYLLQRDVRLAGYGLNTFIPVGCSSIVVWNNSLGSSSNMRLVPFEINPAGVPAGDANTDTILVSYGNSDNFVGGVPADQLASVTDPFSPTQNRDGFRAGDLVIGVQPGGGPGGTTSCVLHELTGVPGANGSCGAPTTGSLLNHGTTAYKSANAGCATVTPTHNASGGITDPGGSPVPKLTQANGAALYNLGGSPQIKVYAVRGGNLTVCDMVSADCSNTANYTVLVNGIVSMRAIYGQDFAGSPPAGSSMLGDGTLDRWSRAALASTNDISRTLAVALEITARSGLKEKPATGTTCDTTPNAARPDRGQSQDWYQPYAALASGSLAGAQIDLSTVSTDWQCYRYKLFQTSVPLRNMIWR